MYFNLLISFFIFYIEISFFAIFLFFFKQIETKYNVTKEGYTALFNEMMEDIPKLLNDRARFFEPIVAVFAKNHAAFYGATANAFETALPSVSAIDDENVHGHKAPITSVENSARYRHRGTTGMKK
eukprot:Phypoly_transcript_22176.p1 GENE.Phypoly_transcript_22176~~Phypoly_transcript_22176.p1  ORF type:complete len:126 (+),score=26.08 Phypoly_transcript_22176:88-465(+)